MMTMKEAEIDERMEIIVGRIVDFRLESVVDQVIIKNNLLIVHY